MIESATTSLESQFDIRPAVSDLNRDGVATFWVDREKLHLILSFLKEKITSPYRMLYDLTAVDERTRVHRPVEETSAFTVVYHLLSFERNEFIRIKTALEESALSPWTPSPICGPRRIGTSARFGTCSASGLPGIRTSGAF